MFWIIVGKIGVFVMTVTWLVFREFSFEKDKYDDKNAKFDKEVWFDQHWDNLVVWVSGAGLLAALSSELAIPLMMKFLPEYADYVTTITYTGVAVCTYAGFNLSQYLKKRK